MREIPSKDEKLADHYAEEIALYQAFYREHSKDQSLEEVIFDHMALGFFLALGVRNAITGDPDYPLADAQALAYQFA